MHHLIFGVAEVAARLALEMAVESVVMAAEQLPAYAAGVAFDYVYKAVQDRFPDVTQNQLTNILSSLDNITYDSKTGIIQIKTRMQAV